MVLGFAAIIEVAEVPNLVPIVVQVSPLTTVYLEEHVAVVGTKEGDAIEIAGMQSNCPI
jgi:hypothetical protein